MFWNRIPRDPMFDHSISAFSRENRDKLFLDESPDQDQFLAEHTQLAIYGKKYTGFVPEAYIYVPPRVYYDYFIVMKHKNKYYAADPLAGWAWDVVELTPEEALRIFALFNFCVRNKENIHLSEIVERQDLFARSIAIEDEAPLMGINYSDSASHQFENYSAPFVLYSISEIENYNPFRKPIEPDQLLPVIKRKLIQHKMKRFISKRGSKKTRDYMRRIRWLYFSMEREPQNKRYITFEPTVRSVPLTLKHGAKARIKTEKLPFSVFNKNENRNVQ